jgi:GGDEF domain-containing protein
VDLLANVLGFQVVRGVVLPREVDEPSRAWGATSLRLSSRACPTRRNAANVAQDVLNSLFEPLVLDGHEIRVSASLGIAVRPPSKRDRLLKDADAAMYRAKRTSGNNYQFYTEETTL